MDRINYRIKVKTELSGKSYYYIQKCILKFFWFNILEDFYYEKSKGFIYLPISFYELEKAKEYIDKCISYDNSIKQQKIVKTEIINYESIFK